MLVLKKLNLSKYFKNSEVLLCKRAIEPRSGFWTLPAGFMENHETCLEAALRESEEEANTHIKNPTLYGIFDLPHISQVYIFYQGEVIDGLFSPGIESLEVKLFKENDIPWKNLAIERCKSIAVFNSLEK